MAIVLEHSPARRSADLTTLVRETCARIVSAWQRHRAEREFEGLSFDLRKDIGFRSQDKSTR